MAVLLAVLASFANALSAILQRVVVQDAPEESHLRIGLMTYALRRPAWLAGLVLIGAGFLLQAVALRFGQLSEVQPVVTTELLFVVLILGIWFRFPVRPVDWLGVAMAGGGLAAFLAVARPVGGTIRPGLAMWGWIGGASALAVAALVVGNRTGPGWLRAGRYGTASAICFALSAALTKVFTIHVTEGWGHVFGHWETYALVVTGVIGLFFAQNAFQAGPVTASQATLTIVDPILSMVIGLVAFGDHLVEHPAAVAVEVGSLVVLFAGVVVMARSPLVADAKDESHGGHRLERRPRSGGRHAGGGSGGGDGEEVS